MKRATLLLIINLIFSFSSNVTAQTIALGTTVNDSIGVLDFTSTTNCYSNYTYPNNYGLSVTFPYQSCTGLRNVLIITEISEENSVSTQAQAVIQIGDTLEFNAQQSTFYFYFNEDAVQLKGTYKTIGRPTVANETYLTGDLSLFIGMSECASPYQYYLNETGTIEDTVQAVQEVYISENSCGDYRFNGVAYTESGTYEQYYINGNGEEVLAHLNLIINQIDVSIEVEEDELEAEQEEGTYQWYSVVNQTLIPIDGATFRSFEPVKSGQYCVSLITETCDTISETVAFQLNETATSGIETLNNKYSYNLYPNPTAGKCTLQLHDNFEKEITIYNNVGTVMHVFTTSLERIEIETEAYPTGTYFIHISTENTSLNIPLIKL